MHVLVLLSRMILLQTFSVMSKVLVDQTLQLLHRSVKERMIDVLFSVTVISIVVDRDIIFELKIAITSEAMQRNGLRSMDTAGSRFVFLQLEIYPSLNATCILCSVRPLFLLSAVCMCFDRVCLGARVKISAHASTCGHVVAFN